MGTVVEVPFAAHGYGSYFALSLLDRYVTAPYFISIYEFLLPCYSVEWYADQSYLVTMIQKHPWKRVLPP
jgi:hypothetical protein